MSEYDRLGGNETPGNLGQGTPQALTEEFPVIPDRGKRRLSNLMSPLSAFNHRFRSLTVDTQGWIICVAVLLLTITRCGLTFSFGVFVAKLETQNNGTAMAVQNWIGTLSFAFTQSLAPVSVLIIRSLGQHCYQIVGVTGVLIFTASCFLSSIVAPINELWLFLTHSVLYGLGSSLVGMNCILLISEYFPKEHKYHVLATSSPRCGFPLGSLLFNPINGWLVDIYGVRVAFIVNGSVNLMVGLSCCLLFLSRLDSDTNEPIDHGDFKRRMGACFSPKQFAVRPEIFMWFLGNMMSFIGFYMPFMNLAYYMAIKNIDLAHSKWTLTVLSLAECITYIIASAVGDLIKGRLITVNISASIGLTITCFAWPYLDTSYAAIMILSAALGGFMGLGLVYQFAASREVTKLPSDVAWSATHFWCGIGIFVGPLFSGVIFDIRHRYSDVWLVSGGLYLAQVFIFAGIPAIWLYRVSTFIPDDYEEIAGDEAATTDATEGRASAAGAEAAAPPLASDGAKTDSDSKQGQPR